MQKKTKKKTQIDWTSAKEKENHRNRNLFQIIPIKYALYFSFYFLHFCILLLLASRFHYGLAYIWHKWNMSKRNIYVLLDFAITATSIEMPRSHLLMFYATGFEMLANQSANLTEQTIKKNCKLIDCTIILCILWQFTWEWVCVSVFSDSWWWSI